MPRITKVYTKKGDGGYTSLGGGQRVSKDSLRIEAYGTVDELNSHLGVALAMGLDDASAEALRAIQNDLFHLGSDLCIREEDKATLKVPTVEERHIEALEGWIDRFNGELPALTNFILPGGTAGSAQLHVARCVARRSERLVVALAHQEAIGEFAVKYLNRLSDLLFVLARRENAVAGVDEPVWDSRR
jgi:cob(I)alamin adenosyltransferase